MQGCDIHCPACQNVSTWNLSSGVEVDVLTLVKELKENVMNKKVTISGGEPLFQKEALIELIKLLKFEDFDIALYTAHTKEEVPQEIITKIKYLKTGPFIKKMKTTIKPYVGSSNQTFERVN
jgi:anaerobic ribonucleoside-triphosphate reductase activating protein